MEARTPIKRSKELTPLSRDHHDGLLLCWKIRKGLNGEVPAVRIRAYVVNFFETHLLQHFRDEERWVFPLLGEDHAGRLMAKQQHEQMQVMVEQMKEQASSGSLKDFADILEKHIRFEERELFNEIERVADPEALKSAGGNITRLAACSDWPDQFWLKENK